MLVKSSGEPVVRGNVMTDNGRYGVHVTLGGLGLIESNDVFSNVGGGIAVTQGGKPVVNHNTVHDEPGPGIWVSDAGSLLTGASNSVSASESAACVHVVCGGDAMLEKCRM